MTIRPKKGFVKKGAEGVSEDAYQFYSFGPFFDGEIWATGKSEEELFSFWKEHKIQIMKRYMAELRAKGPSWAGNRPEYFWREINIPRLKTGVQKYYNPWPDREEHYRDIFESDREFLGRLGLLEAWEK